MALFGGEIGKTFEFRELTREEWEAVPWEDRALFWIRQYGGGFRQAKQLHDLADHFEETASHISGTVDFITTIRNELPPSVRRHRIDDIDS